MGPYPKQLTRITDISPYFKTNDDYSVTFTGTSLELRIPRDFQSSNSLIIGDGSVTTPGIMDMIINNEYHTGLNILASLTIEPSDIGKFNYKGLDYVTLFLNEGDTFIQSTRVLQNQNLVYTLWTIFVTAGKVPYFFNYASLLSLFEHARKLTGAGIGVSRSVFEGIIAHLARDPDKITMQYRLTDMSKPMKLVALKSVSNAPSSTISRLNGAYFTSDGLTAALRHQVNDQQPFENILRGISNPDDDHEDHPLKGV